LCKNIPLSLKCQLLGDFVPRTFYTGFVPRPYLDLAPGPHGDFSPPYSLFCGVQKILKYYGPKPLPLHAVVVDRLTILTV